MGTILSVKNITKRYPGVLALNNVSIDFEEGEVHALLGENGAGKSTLIKVMAGAVECDEGVVEIQGKEFLKLNPQIARDNGIEVIYQEYNLIPSLTVAENICLGSKGKGLVNYKYMNELANSIFQSFNININPNALVSELSPAHQQLVEIAKAVSKNSKIIIMDEPSAQLTASEVLDLYEIIRELKRKKVLVIYISHRMEEIFEVTDRVSVMRDGQYISTVQTKNTDRNKLIELMVGRELKESYPTRKAHSDEIVLEVKNLNGYSNTDVSFALKKGEILGFAGLVGAGRTELMRTIFGADKMLSGQIYKNGEKIKIKSPKQAIAHGIGLIPEDRKLQGCFLRSAIDWNISISCIKKYSKYGFINEEKVDTLSKNYAELLNIKTPSLKQTVANLSGGNQQKVVLAKVLASRSEIIVFDEPTRGIDVGTRQEIYYLMNRLVEEGKSIIMISSDMEELLGMSDRIIVIAEGKIAGELAKDEFSQTKILNMASIG